MPPAASLATARPRLLVVDDSRAMQAILRRMLACRSLGKSEVRTVADGEAALEALEGFAAQLVISDWHMPRMGGLELLQTLRQTGRTGLPVGFVTTETSAPLLQQARTNGAAFVVQKPFRDEVLLSAVRTALRAATEPAMKEAPTLVDAAGSAKVMRRIVQAWMPGVPFSITEGERFDSEHLSARNLLATYSPNAGNGNGIGVLAAADMPALCMLGGGALQADPKDIRRAIQDEKPSPEIIESASRFFRDLDAMLSHQLPVGEARFRGAELVPRDHARLRAAVSDSPVRVDYRLSVPGYGDGRLVLIRA
jgi:CheY-like chemotaxis protein